MCTIKINECRRNFMSEEKRGLLGENLHSILLGTSQASARFHGNFDVDCVLSCTKNNF